MRTCPAAIAGGARIIVLSDRTAAETWSGRDRAPIPSLLLTGAVHHHLIKEKTRTRVGLVVEAGDVRESHHVALLIGYGAAAVNPYLAIETVADLVRSGVLDGITARKAEANLIKALGKGVLKIMSKMGVSTVASYTGAQIFEAVGLSDEVIGRCFTGTTSRLGGVGFDVLAREARCATRPRSLSLASHSRTAIWKRVASTNGGGRANRICSTRRRCSSFSTPPAAAVTRYSRSTRA